MDEDFLLVDLNGELVESGYFLKLLVEMFLYIYLYNKINVGCCLYVYMVNNNVILELYGD